MANNVKAAEMLEKNIEELRDVLKSQKIILATLEKGSQEKVIKEQKARISELEGIIKKDEQTAKYIRETAGE